MTFVAENPRWLLNAAGDVLPTDVETQLLQVCLLDPASARQAWARFSQSSGGVQAFFEDNTGGLKGLLPYLESRLNSQGVSADPAFHTYARVALVREELRSTIYEDVLQTLLARLEQQGIASILLKGGAISRVAYPPGTLRHNHGIDLLVRPADLAEIGGLVLNAGCERAPDGSPHEGFRYFRHNSGLSISIRTQLFDIPYLGQQVARLWEDSLVIADAGRGIRVLCPEHNLLHTLGTAAYSATRNNLRWVCDSRHLLDAAPAFRWEHFRDATIAAGLSLPAVVMLSYLGRAMAADVPDRTLGDLSRHVAPDGPRARRARQTFLLSLVPARRRSATGAPWPMSEALSMFWFRLLPPPDYLRWKYRTRSRKQVLALYVTRPVRRFARLLERPRPAGEDDLRGAPSAGGVR